MANNTAIDVHNAYNVEAFQTVHKIAKEIN